MYDRLLFWEKFINPVKILAFRENSNELKLQIIQLLTQNHNLFYSITKSHDEITIIIDNSIELFHNYDYREEYIAYNLLNIGSLMEESGLIKKITTILNHYNIPIMYLTSFNNNYLFVPKNYEEITDQLVKNGLDYEAELEKINK